MVRLQYMNEITVSCKFIECKYDAVPGGTCCMKHGGNSQLEKIKRNSIQKYYKNQFANQIKVYAEDIGIKSLNEEIGVLRMLLSRRLESCEDAQQLLEASSSLAMLIGQIEKLVSSCTSIEKTLGLLVAKTEVAEFADTVVEIIQRNIKDESTLDNIINDIGRSMK